MRDIQVDVRQLFVVVVVGVEGLALYLREDGHCLAVYDDPAMPLNESAMRRRALERWCWRSCSLVLGWRGRSQQQQRCCRLLLVISPALACLLRPCLALQSLLGALSSVLHDAR